MGNAETRRRYPRDGSVSVSGPGYERDGLPTVGSGISGASTAAWRYNADGTWYVRLGGDSRYAVERRGRTIYVTAMGRGAGT